MKKKIKDIQHQLNNELAKLFPTIDLMAESPDDNHAHLIKRLSVLIDRIMDQTTHLSTELSLSQAQSLFHLSYISKWVPSENGIEEDIERIVSKARSFNHDYDVTGLLVYQSNHFIQYLEGEIEDLYTVYGRICADPRHERHSILSLGPIQERNFLGWDMDSYILTADEEILLEPLRSKFAQGRGAVTSFEVLSFMNLIKGYKLKNKSG